jgi:hypothetical protein
MGGRTDLCELVGGEGAEVGEHLARKRLVNLFVFGCFLVVGRTSLWVRVGWLVGMVGVSVNVSRVTWQKRQG